MCIKLISRSSNLFEKRRRIGTPMEPDDLRRSWGRVRTTARLTGTRLHDMRHPCVSLPLHLAVAPDMVREIGGRSDIEVTMAIYAHTSLNEKRQTPGKLGDALTYPDEPVKFAVAVTAAVKRPGRRDPPGRFGWSEVVVRGGVEPPTFRLGELLGPQKSTTHRLSRPRRSANRGQVATRLASRLGIPPLTWTDSCAG
jgi:hypothetical protein